MKFRAGVVGLLALSTFLPHALADDNQWNGLPDSLQRVFAGHGIDPDDVGVFVQELGATTPTLQHNAGAPFNPASTIKLLTTWLALAELGPQWTWPRSSPTTISSTRYT